MASGDPATELARSPNRCDLGGRERSPNSTTTNHRLPTISWKVTVAGAAEGATGGRKCPAFVHGDVACIVFDVPDYLAPGGGCEGVPALREDVLRYSVKSRQATSQRRIA